MKRAATILIAVIAVSQLVPAQATTMPPSTGVVVHDAAPGESAVMDWVIDRFESAGLDLPGLDVYVHDSQAGCDGHDGLYMPHTGRDRIDICTDSVFIILHEFGHAWEHNYATDTARQGLMAELDLTAWTGNSVKYRKRGEEVAANLIAWALIERPLSEAETRTDAAALARFESLTGNPSPRLTD